MQEDNQLAVAAEPPQAPDPPVIEQQPEGGEQEQQQTTEQQPPQRQVSPDVEARAVKDGWRPKDQWRGDPDAWLPADEFVRRGEQVMPILRSRTQRAEAEVANLRGQIDAQSRDFEDRLCRLDRVSQVALQNQAQQIGQYYHAQMRQAVERGDTAEWDNLNRQYATEIGNLQNKTAEAYSQQPAQPEAPKIDPEWDKAVRTWVSQQDWWQSDRNMTAAATNYHGFLLQTKPWLTPEANLEETERFLEREFPDKLGRRAPANGGGQRQPQQQQHAPAMEAGTRQPAGAGRAKGWNELPSEAKQAGDSFIRNDGLFLPDGANPERLSDADLTKARAAYAKRYWE